MKSLCLHPDNNKIAIAATLVEVYGTDTGIKYCKNDAGVWVPQGTKTGVSRELYEYCQNIQGTDIWVYSTVHSNWNLLTLKQTFVDTVNDMFSPLFGCFNTPKVDKPLASVVPVTVAVPFQPQPEPLSAMDKQYTTAVFDTPAQRKLTELLRKDAFTARVNMLENNSRLEGDFITAPVADGRINKRDHQNTFKIH